MIGTHWRTALVMAMAAAGCAAIPAVRAGGEDAAPGVASDPIVRVALATNAAEARISGTGSWRVYEGDRPGIVMVRGAAGSIWTAEQGSGRLRLRRADGVPTEWHEGPLLVRPLNERDLVVVNGKQYRGDVLLVPVDSGFAVVNRLRMELYLRGVVPLEIGPDRRDSEHAAVEAQAVAARSYAMARLAISQRRDYDLRSSTADQVYGGVGAERRVSNTAIEKTAGLVLTYGGRLVSAPYHSACGGSTAEPSEVWQGAAAAPYLRRVSDRIPGSEGYYCEIAPRFKWTRSWDETQLDTLVHRYLRRVASGRGARGSVRQVKAEGRTPSGRATALLVETDGGTARLRPNELRAVFRSASGEMLNSTYVTGQTVERREGGETLSRLTLQGMGYGHGVGMCQWGAIGRARAGHDFRSILLAYFPNARISSLR